MTRYPLMAAVGSISQLSQIPTSARLGLFHSRIQSTTKEYRTVDSLFEQ